jgi:hypothetical protein
MDDFDYYMKMDLTPYLDEWIAICDCKLISHKKKLKDIFSDVDVKCKDKIPLITKVPGNEKWFL